MNLLEAFSKEYLESKFGKYWWVINDLESIAERIRSLYYPDFPEKSYPINTNVLFKFIYIIVNHLNENPDETKNLLKQFLDDFGEALLLYSILLKEKYNTPLLNELKKIKEYKSLIKWVKSLLIQKQIFIKNIKKSKTPPTKTELVPDAIYSGISKVQKVRDESHLKEILKEVNYIGKTKDKAFHDLVEVLGFDDNDVYIYQSPKISFLITISKDINEIKNIDVFNEDTIIKIMQNKKEEIYKAINIAVNATLKEPSPEIAEITTSFISGLNGVNKEFTFWLNHDAYQSLKNLFSKEGLLKTIIETDNKITVRDFISSMNTLNDLISSKDDLLLLHTIRYMRYILWDVSSSIYYAFITKNKMVFKFFDTQFNLFRAARVADVPLSSYPKDIIDRMVIVLDFIIRLLIKVSQIMKSLDKEIIVNAISSSFLIESLKKMYFQMVSLYFYLYGLEFYNNSLTYFLDTPNSIINKDHNTKKELQKIFDDLETKYPKEIIEKIRKAYEFAYTFGKEKNAFGKGKDTDEKEIQVKEIMMNSPQLNKMLEFNHAAINRNINELQDFLDKMHELLGSPEADDVKEFLLKDLPNSISSENVNNKVIVEFTNQFVINSDKFKKEVSVFIEEIVNSKNVPKVLPDFDWDLMLENLSTFEQALKLHAIPAYTIGYVLIFSIMHTLLIGMELKKEDQLRIKSIKNQAKDKLIELGVL